jgi:hypothetical protein
MLSRSADRAGLLAVLLMVWVGTAGAQLRTDPARWAVGQDGIRLVSEAVVDLRTTTPAPIDPYAYRRGLFSAIGLYEYKPATVVLGQYSRPHYALGFQSELMRDAMAFAGLDAESCVAPMVRMRARQAAVTGDTSLSMTMLARCTFR